MKDAPTLWYEDAEGERWAPPANHNGSAAPPDGFVYQWSRFPRMLHESCLKIEDGKSKEILRGSSSWPGDLVLAMVRPTWRERAKSFLRYGSCPARLNLDQAILRAAGCEHCINTLAYRYGLNWGYQAGRSGDNSRTSCEHCREAVQLG